MCFLGPHTERNLRGLFQSATSSITDWGVRGRALEGLGLPPLLKFRVLSSELY